MAMFWNPRKEEEVFSSKQVVEEEKVEIPDTSLREIKEKIKEDFKEHPLPTEIAEARQNFEMEAMSSKLNKITEQINTMARYLTYLSDKFDRTLDSAVVYDRNLDEIEARINNLKQRIEDFDLSESNLDLERSAGEAG
jgi:DNA repair ATPase RecN